MEQETKKKHTLDLRFFSVLEKPKENTLDLRKRKYLCHLMGIPVFISVDYGYKQ